jgi:DNA-binding CsgD family transcriptional regulator
MGQQPLSKKQTNTLVRNVLSAPAAKAGFDIIAALTLDLGFRHCLVLEAVMTIVSNGDWDGRTIDQVALIFSNHKESVRTNLARFLSASPPFQRHGDRDFLMPRTEPFAMGTRWYQGMGIVLSRAEQQYYKALDDEFRPSGIIGFPVRSSQSDLMFSSAVLMSSDASADELSAFLHDVAPSVQPVIDAYETRLYPHLIDPETLRVGLSQRELDCLTMIANGYNTKGVAHRLDITIAMVSRHIRNAQDKLRVPNVATAVLKAQRLNLIEF